MKIRNFIAVLVSVALGVGVVLFTVNTWTQNKIDNLTEQNAQIVEYIARYMTETAWEVDENGNEYSYPPYSGGGMKEICDHPISNNSEIANLIEIYMTNEHEIYRLKANKI